MNSAAAAGKNVEMSRNRNSDKLNIIDFETYQNIQQTKGSVAPQLIRNAKYKNKHKSQQQQCSLLDFVAVPRQKQKRDKKRPRLCIKKSVGGIVGAPAKRKGKTRLQPKLQVTRLKRNIQRYREWKQAKQQQQQALDEEAVQPLRLDMQALSLAQQSDEIQTQQLQTKLQDLTLSEIAATTSSHQPTKTAPPHAIHSRRFRSYCDNCTLPRLAELTTQLLRDLDRFQKRAFASNEFKARAHQRFVVGLRQAQSQLRINKVKLLILATDCEPCPGEDGLDGTIDDLKSACQQQSVPYCFSLQRRQLAFALRKRAQLCCVAILDYDGAQATHKELLEVLASAREEYNKRIGAS